MQNQPVLQLFAVCSAVVVLTLYMLGVITARTRNQRKAVINPEDVKVNSGAKVVDEEHADVLRIKRAHLNGLENAVPFFVIGFLYTMTDPSLVLARVLFITFAVVRVLHAVFYLNAKQPFRTAAFGVAALVNVIMLVQVVRAAIPGLA